MFAGMAPGKQTGNQENGTPQVAAGENPLFGATDISQGREVTPEWGVKQGDGTRPPFPSWSSDQPIPCKRSNVELSGAASSRPTRTTGCASLSTENENERTIEMP